MAPSGALGHWRGTLKAQGNDMGHFKPTQCINIHFFLEGNVGGHGGKLNNMKGFIFKKSDLFVLLDLVKNGEHGKKANS